MECFDVFKTKCFPTHIRKLSEQHLLFAVTHQVVRDERESGTMGAIGNNGCQRESGGVLLRCV